MDASESAVVHGLCSGWTVKRDAMDGKERSAISAGTSRILDVMEETRLMLQRRVSPERVRRLTLFGCSRHPDAEPVSKLQTINLEWISILFLLPQSQI